MEDLKKYQDEVNRTRQNAQDMNQWGFLGNNLLGKVFGLDSVMNNKQSLMNSYYSNAYNSAEAAKNRNFQEQMSNTSYQRAAKDLGALGFSPLALVSPGNSAASTPSGSTASSSGGASVHASKGSAVVMGLIRALIGVGVNSSIANANLSKAAYFNALKGNIKSPGSSAGGIKGYDSAEMKEIYRIVKTPWLDDD